MATRVTTAPGRRVLVVPLIRIAPSLAALSYSVPTGLSVSPGDCVRIPFRTKTIAGIVWAEDSSSAARETKAILNLDGDAALTHQQAAFARWLHRTTLTPLNVILRGMVPGTRTNQPSYQPGSAEVTAVECASNQARREVMAKWVQRIGAAGGRTLIVVPNQGAAEQWLVAGKNLRPLVITPPRSLSAQQQLRLALAATQTYITTHAGLLYPLPALKRIVVDLADDEAYLAFDQAPRVDLRAAARALAREHGADVLVLTRWLSPAVVGAFPGLQPTLVGRVPEVTVVDRQNEPSGERGRVPPANLLERLKNTRTLWLHNRTREAGRYVCADCGTPVQCPTCGKPMRVQSQKPLVLVCPQDNVRLAGPEQCTVCRGTRLSTRGAGVQQVARAIAESTGASVAMLERGSSDGDVYRATHVVATTAIGSYPDASFRAVVVLQADSYLAQPGYRSVEQFFSAFALARSAVDPTGMLYAVTYKPETPAFAFLNNPDGWTQGALHERQALHYPPAGTLVVLQPRHRLTKPAAQPFPRTEIPAGVVQTRLAQAWLLRTSWGQQETLLAWVQQALDPTWEAVVNPPALPED